jgi:hypothetical protein
VTVQTLFATLIQNGSKALRKFTHDNGLASCGIIKVWARYFWRLFHMTSLRLYA